MVLALWILEQSDGSVQARQVERLNFAKGPLSGACFGQRGIDKLRGQSAHRCIARAQGRSGELCGKIGLPRRV
jgi:hypothetical protein